MGATIVQGDALDQESISEAITKASEKGDGISGVAHLVGSIAIRPPHAIEFGCFQRGNRYQSQQCIPNPSLCGKAMLKMGGGRMVFTSSVAGSPGLVNHEAIAAAKGGVESMVSVCSSNLCQERNQSECSCSGID